MKSSGVFWIYQLSMIKAFLWLKQQLLLVLYSTVLTSINFWKNLKNKEKNVAKVLKHPAIII